MSIYTQTNIPTGFYIYAYVREDGTPYYIGKGQGTRAWDPHSRKHSKVPVPEDDRIVIMECNLTNIGSLALERFYIKWYGRKTNGGILINLTDGGDGSLGCKASDATRKKISRKVRGENNPMYGKSFKSVMTPEAIEERQRKISEYLKGRVFSEEHKQKLRKPKPQVTCPHCGKVGGKPTMYRFHFNSCKELRT